MPRIKLAHWVGEHKPGDEIEVSAVELAALSRDGRVAAVVEAPADQPPVPSQEVPAQPEPVVEQQPEPAAEAGRKRR
jgi:hypothetical protein